MKKYLRLFLINLFSLWLVASSLSGVSFSGGYRTLMTAALVLTLANLLVKPLIKLLLLPVNLLTLGAFRWLTNVLILYLVTLIVPQLEINGFLFPGFSYQGFIMPAIYLSIFWAFVVVSLLISLITTSLLWLVR